MKVLTRLRNCVEYIVNSAGELSDEEPSNLAHDIRAAIKAVEQLQQQLAVAQEALRWRRTDDPPKDIDWDQVVEALEYESEEPLFMTMAAIFMDEGSEVEYWRPITFPKGEDNG